MKKLTASAALALVLSVGISERSHSAALFLDGVGDWVDLAATATGVFPSGPAPFTIGAWINPTSIPAGGGSGGQITFWGTQGPANTANGFRQASGDGMNHYFWGNDNVVDPVPSGDMLGDTTGPNGDGWHHVAITFDGADQQLYHNGVPIGPLRTAGTVAVADANHRIGSRIDAEYFHGFIDELTVWGGALSASDIAGGWNAPIDLNDPLVQAALISYHTFENGLNDSAALGGNQSGVAMGDALIDPNANAPLIPEPSSALLSLLGLGFLLRRRR